MPTCLFFSSLFAFKTFEAKDSSFLTYSKDLSDPSPAGVTSVYNFTDLSGRFPRGETLT